MNNIEENANQRQDDDWTPVVSKKTVKKAKEAENRAKLEQRRLERDVRYLLTHAEFQQRRVSRDILKKIASKASTDGSVHLTGQGPCVGHAIDYNANAAQKRCLECDWTSNQFDSIHCCCSEETKSCLPSNFYLGCGGCIPINEYLSIMREEPLKEYDR
jgi:hypothetical protein